jgi:hypothetical protein
MNLIGLHVVYTGEAYSWADMAMATRLITMDFSIIRCLFVAVVLLLERNRMAVIIVIAWHFTEFDPLPIRGCPPPARISGDIIVPCRIEKLLLL